MGSPGSGAKDRNTGGHNRDGSPRGPGGKSSGSSGGAGTKALTEKKKGSSTKQGWNPGGGVGGSGSLGGFATDGGANPVDKSAGTRRDYTQPPGYQPGGSREKLRGYTPGDTTWGYTDEDPASIGQWATVGGAVFDVLSGPKALATNAATGFSGYMSEDENGDLQPGWDKYNRSLAGQRLDKLLGGTPGVGTQVATHRNPNDTARGDDARMSDRARAVATSELTGGSLSPSPALATGDGDFSDVELQDRRRPRPDTLSLMRRLLT